MRGTEVLYIISLSFYGNTEEIEFMTAMLETRKGVTNTQPT